jgi:mannose-1-phosphate guanylyltransferase
MGSASSAAVVRCGIVLAAGEGERLRHFIRQLRGDGLPKQYVNFIGTRSLLEHTFSRAEILVPPERLFTVISRRHLGYPEVREQLSSRPGGTVVVQPENKDTGPGLLLPLMHLYKRHPDSTVAVFPSDHFVIEESLFMAHVDLACRVVERYPAYIVLLGIEPEEPEPEYGYILPGDKVAHLPPLSIHGVSQFIEKPPLHVARELIRQGGLWNTLVMVFKVRTLLKLVRLAAPSLHRSFKRIEEVIGAPLMDRVVEEVYRHMNPVNFSRALLEPLSRNVSQLLVAPVRGVHWCDWGSERRIMSEVGTVARLQRRLEIREDREAVLAEEAAGRVKRRIAW